MTAYKDLRRIVSDRQNKTGESYTAARVHVMRDRRPPEPELTDTFADRSIRPLPEVRIGSLRSGGKRTRPCQVHAMFHALGNLFSVDASAGHRRTLSIREQLSWPVT